ncbi:MAG: HesA/MoeB/ThiF family protein [DPANN group archaeon]|nr:HesA/MoeB/ThiF family protein [DPANN group archaeon]
MPDSMSDRYARQEALPAIGKAGQKKLGEATVTIVGLGAIGSHAAELLLRAGVHNLILIDDDMVELSNLQRQALYTEKDIGLMKADAIARHLQAIDGKARLGIHTKRMDEGNMDSLLPSMGRDAGRVVLDCTDNLETRYLIDARCKSKNIPWVHAACVGWWGEVKVFPSFSSSVRQKTYQDIFPDKKTPLGCVDAGVLNHAVAMTAAIQVGETVKLILGEPPTEELMRINAWKHTIEKIRV